MADPSGEPTEFHDSAGNDLMLRLCRAILMLLLVVVGPFAWFVVLFGLPPALIERILP